MSNYPDYVTLFNQSLNQFFKDALRVSLSEPAMAFFWLQTLRRQKQAARRRLAWEGRGVHVPPFMIASITKRCNLRCKGCYAHAQRRPAEAELSAARLRSIMTEAQELGVSIVMIAGGEPLTRPEILDITAEQPGILFPLFTNGMLLTPELITKLKRQKNVTPILSLEGHQFETDARRGAGVHAHLQETMQVLKAQRIFFGASLTVTQHNFETVTGREFIAGLSAAGCKLFFFVDYVPIQEGTEALCMTDAQRQAEPARLMALRAEFPGLFVAFPGDEEMYGGCLAAGRGFVHISPEGRLEPCPFAPFSDISLRDVSLRQALQSGFLAKIRASSHDLTETRGGCALWARREWVGSLLQSS